MFKHWPEVVHGTEVSLCRRFPAEKGIDANKGLNIAQDLLEPIKKQFPWISYSDLWTLAGAVAIEEMGGQLILSHTFQSRLNYACDIDRQGTT